MKKQFQSYRNCSLRSGTDTWWSFMEQSPKSFFFHVFKTIKQLTTTLKTLHTYPKKLYYFMTNCFPSLMYQLLTKYNMTYRNISYPVPFTVRWLVLWRYMRPCKIALRWKYTSIKHRKTSLQELRLQVEQAKSFFNMIFSVESKAAGLNHSENEETKRSFSLVYCSFLTDF